MFELVSYLIANMNGNFPPSDLTIPKKTMYLYASYHSKGTLEQSGLTDLVMDVCFVSLFVRMGEGHGEM